MTCPVCGGAGIVDTSPPGVEGAAMRRDVHSTTPAEAEAWERNHAPQPIPDHDGITAADVDFTMPAEDSCGGCGEDACLVCALQRVYDNWRNA